jgi:hypothetical protein
MEVSSSETAWAPVVGLHGWDVGLLSCQTLLFNAGRSMTHRFHSLRLALSNVFNLAEQLGCLGDRALRAELDTERCHFTQSFEHSIMIGQ